MRAKRVTHGRASACKDSIRLANVLTDFVNGPTFTKYTKDKTYSAKHVDREYLMQPKTQKLIKDVKNNMRTTTFTPITWVDALAKIAKDLSGTQ